MRVADGHKLPHAEITKLLDDPAPDVRFAAAELLVREGSGSDAERALALLAAAADWSKNDVFTTMAALNALSSLGEKAAPLADTIKSLPSVGAAPHARFKEYVPRLLGELRERFK